MTDKEYILEILKELFPTEIEDTLETVVDYLIDHGVTIRNPKQPVLERLKNVK